MRTFRIPLAGAIILSLLLGAATATVAQTVTIPDGAADHVTGTLVNAEHVYGPEPAPGLPGVMRNKWRYQVEWDGAIQLPASVSLVMSEDVHFMAGPDALAVICWGHVAFEDEDGYMVGPFRGYMDDTGEVRIQAMVEGGGIYEGLNAILSGPIGGPGGGPIDGLLFEGYMPQS